MVSGIYDQGHVAYGMWHLVINSLSKLDTVWLTNQLFGAFRPHYGSIKTIFALIAMQLDLEAHWRISHLSNLNMNLYAYLL